MGDAYNLFRYIREKGKKIKLLSIYQKKIRRIPGTEMSNKVKHNYIFHEVAIFHNKDFLL